MSENTALPKIEGYFASGTTRDDVLNEMAGYLAAKGAVKETYGAAVIERENTYPTGIPSEPIGVAIPHSERRDLVLDTTILVAKLAQDVRFQRIDDADLQVGVRVIFMLAVDSNQGQLETIATVMELVQDEKLIQKIVEATSPEEIQQAVSAAYCG